MMKKSLNILFALMLTLFTFGGQAVFADAANIEDGEHEINIEAIEANEDKVSVADSFLSDTATLSVQDGDIQFTLAVAKGGEGEGEFGDFDFDIEWVTVEGSEHISEEDGGDVTYYTFPLDNVKEVLNAGMEYVVEDFPGLEDGHEVDFRIQLNNLNDLPTVDNEEDSRESDDESDKENGDSETNGKDRKSTRLNSSHVSISYAVFCLKKKKTTYGLR